MKIEWHDKKVLKVVNELTDKATRTIANDVMADAKRILAQKAKSKTEKGLLSQFSIQESKFKDGGLLVYCQGPGRWSPPYHASFVELGSYSSVYGTYKRSKAGGSLKGISPVYIHPKPFMRPARKKNLSKARKIYKNAIDKL